MKPNNLLLPILLFCSVLCFPFIAWTQVCPQSGSIELETEEDLMTFANNNANCTEYNGQITISGNTIQSLEQLSFLRKIDELSIFANNLSNLSGLDSLTELRSLNIRSCNNLESLTGLNGSILDITQAITIRNNPKLTSIAALSGIDNHFSQIQVENNDALLNLDGLEGVTSTNIIIRGNDQLQDGSALCHLFCSRGIKDVFDLSGSGAITISNPNPSVQNIEAVLASCPVGFCTEVCDNSVMEDEDLDGDFNEDDEDCDCQSGDVILSSQQQVDAYVAYYKCKPCTSIKGNLILFGEDIKDLSGLSFITDIEGDLDLAKMTKLQSLTGLENITSIGKTLRLNNLDSLTNLNELKGSVLGTINDNLTIRFNDRLSDISALSGITSIGGQLLIGSNPALTSLAGLEEITSVGRQVIIDNHDNISDCSALCNLFTNGTVEEMITLKNNTSGCNNPIQIIDACEPTPECDDVLVIGPPSNDVDLDFNFSVDTNHVTFNIIEGYEEGIRYLWKYDTLSWEFSTDSTQVFTAPLAGVYNISLRKMGSCISTVSHTVTVSPTLNIAENTFDNCRDGIDNDNDGIIDELDPDCACQRGENIEADFTYEISNERLILKDNSTFENRFQADWSYTPVSFDGVTFSELTIDSVLFTRLPSPVSLKVCRVITNDCGQEKSFCQTITRGGDCPPNIMTCDDFNVAVSSPIPNPTCTAQTMIALGQGGTRPYQYNWTSDGLNTDSIFIANNNYYGTQILTVTDANGCEFRDTFIIPDPTALSANLNYIVTDSSIQFSLDDQINVRDYSLRNTDLPGSIDLNNLSIPLPPPGTYFLSLEIYNACGGERLATVQNIVIEGDGADTCPDSLRIIPDFDYLCTLSPLVGIRTNITADKYTWDLGNGTTEVVNSGNEQGLIIPRYFEGGTYQISVIAETGNCIDTAYYELDVQSNYSEFGVAVVGNTVNVVALPGVGSRLNSFTWIFGDGTVINTVNETTTYTYSNEGTYTITLTTEGPCNPTVFTQEVTIQNTNLENTFSACADGIDNDGDGKIDGGDQECICLEASISGEQDCCDDFTANTSVTNSSIAQADGSIHIVPIGGSGKLEDILIIADNVTFETTDTGFVAYNVASGTYTINLLDTLINCQQELLAEVVTAQMTDCSDLQLEADIFYDDVGASVTFSASGGTSPYQFTDPDSGNPISLNSTRNCRARTFYVKITDANGCMVIDSVKTRSLEVEGTLDYTIEGDSIQFSFIEGDNISFAEVDFSTLPGPITFDMKASIPPPGTYQVCYRIQSSCSTKFPCVVVNIEGEACAPAVADFNFEITEEHILLEDLSTGPITIAQWISNVPGLNGSNSLPLPAEGSYEICRRVENECEEVDQICKTITISSGPSGGAGALPTELTSYPWLTDILDFNNCGTSRITVFEFSGYIYLWVETGSSSNIYNAAGALYCPNTPTYNCFDFYTIDREIYVWNCGAVAVVDTDNDGTNSDIDPDDNDPCVPNMDAAACSIQTFPPFLDDYPALKDLVDFDNCVNTTITIFRSNGYNYILIEKENSSIMYNSSGQYYCENLANFDCENSFPMDEVLGVWSCGEGSGTTVDNDSDGVLFEDDLDDNDPCVPDPTTANCNAITPQIFEDFPFLLEDEIVDPFNCAGAKITIYTSGIYDYVYVETNTSFIMYNSSGQLYCTGSSSFNCAEESYGYTNITGSWTCGTVVVDIDNDGVASDTDPDDTDPCIPNNTSANCQAGTTTPQIFEDYPFLITDNRVNPFDCSGEKITVYSSGAYTYVYVETASSSTLYTSTGQFYCTSSASYDCIDLYGFTTVIGSWSCGEVVTDMDNDGTPSDVDPDDGDPCIPNASNPACLSGGTEPPIFLDYTWLSSKLDPFNCTSGQITVYVNGIYKYINVETETSTILYTESGDVYCTSGPGYDCISLYGFTEMASVWVCGDNTIDADRDGVLADNDPDDTDPCIPNENSAACSSGGELPEIFTTYDWLEEHIDPFNCTTERITVYATGIYRYINVETPTSTILYQESGDVYCTSGPGYDCISLYGYTEADITSVWECGAGTIESIQNAVVSPLKLDTSHPIADFNIYPNPTNGRFFVALSERTSEEQVLRIIGLQGQLIQQRTIQANSQEPVEVDLQGQASGVYLVQVITKDQIQSKRIILE